MLPLIMKEQFMCLYRLSSFFCTTLSFWAGGGNYLLKAWRLRQFGGTGSRARFGKANLLSAIGRGDEGRTGTFSLQLPNLMGLYLAISSKVSINPCFCLLEMVCWFQLGLMFLYPAQQERWPTSSVSSFSPCPPLLFVVFKI